MKKAIPMHHVQTIKKSHKMGFWTILLFGINGIIGSGIFLLPNEGMKLFGPASLLVLGFDALLILTIGLCFAEDASLFKETGGPYVYAKAAFGNFVGYEVGFVTWAIRIIAEGTLYVGFATALAGVFPQLNNIMAKDIIVTILALSLMSMNLVGVQVASIVNNVITVSKLVPLIIFIAVGIWFIKGPNFTPFVPAAVANTSSFSLAAITMFYVFTGVEGAVVAAGEMKNPQKDLPHVLIIIILAVATFYILIQAVCIGVLGSSLANSVTPVQDAFAKIAGGFGKYLIAAGTLLSIGGICVSSSFITPRSGVAMANHGMMPKMLAEKNRFGVPYHAIIISALLGLAIALSGTFNTLAQISAVSRFAQYIPSCIAVLVFRKTMKNRKSDFKIPFGWLIPVVAVTVSVLLLSQTNLVNLAWGFGALLVAVPFYFLSRKNFD
ncbi:amino acid permease [Companilactobacillus crustorum]|uniref:Amino acid permease n=3 Tax=Companilactobacillus TaxID=2767879 RepID=A0A837REG7_9LACO|nr:APC family permease [Companilactobacillus crustorum]KRK41063.1 amino acid permease [Companilactobacillus crustorum JCM 15951]KRO17425.1 amino acid permease [Companilactobacillus crustorum]WDT66859.1 APC family permease [Companilactobacillus crustorum]GEO77601.1 amino acid permease [Companilactobacillus crustorum]